MEHNDTYYFGDDSPRRFKCVIALGAPLSICHWQILEAVSRDTLMIVQHRLREVGGDLFRYTIEDGIVSPL